MRSFAFGIISLLAVIPFINGLTECQIERIVIHARSYHTVVRNLRFVWDIQCDEEGNYKSLQCTTRAIRPVWCECYKDNYPITPQSLMLKTCVCPLARDFSVAEPSPLDKGCPNFPDCTLEGKFQAIQCCTRTGECRCVNPETGEETVAPTTDWSDLSCPTTNNGTEPTTSVNEQD